MPHTSVAALVLRWYATHARRLPWRTRVTPYRTWVSEVMLQQTRVDAAIPYFRRWMQRFPSLRALAAAPERSVLVLWEGLGYYSRARNLHRASRIVVRQCNGRIPSDPQVLRGLPGVGEYTAAAISSIAFGRDVVALDANVRRVLARLGCMRLPITSAAALNRLRTIASRHLPQGRAGDFNQALMDLGALICVPHQPNCAACPLITVCLAHRRGLEARIPMTSRSRPRPHYLCGAAVIRRRGRVLLVRRNSEGLLGGLWEFPKSRHRLRSSGRPQFIRDLKAGTRDCPRILVADAGSLIIVNHAYSHFSITVHAFNFTVRSGIHGPGMLWVPIGRLSAYPMGKVDRTIAIHLRLAASQVAPADPSPRRPAGRG